MRFKFVFSLVIFLALKSVVSIDKKNVEINCQSSIKSIFDVLIRDESDAEVIFKLFSGNSNSTRNKTNILNFKLDEKSHLKNGRAVVNGEPYEHFREIETGLHDEDGDVLKTEVFKEVEERDCK